MRKDLRRLMVMKWEVECRRVKEERVGGNGLGGIEKVEKWVIW